MHKGRRENTIGISWSKSKIGFPLLSLCGNTRFRLIVYYLINASNLFSCRSDVSMIARKHLEMFQINTTGATSGAGTAYPSGVPVFSPSYQRGSCYSISSFMCMFCRSLCVLLSFFFWPFFGLCFFDLRILITPLVSSNSSMEMTTLMFDISTSSFFGQHKKVISAILWREQVTF